MWLANLDWLKMLDRVTYEGSNSWLVPVHRNHRWICAGENLIVGRRGQGVIGYGKILSAPMKLSAVRRQDRIKTKEEHSSYHHMYITLDQFTNADPYFPYSIVYCLPRDRRCKQPLIVGEQYIYLTGHYDYKSIMYLIEGCYFYEDSNSYGDYESRITSRLHYLYDVGKSWYLKKIVKGNRAKGETTRCRYCNVEHNFPETFFQVHYGGSMKAGSDYSKENCAVLCPSCHAIEDMLVVRKNELFSGPASQGTAEGMPNPYKASPRQE